MSRSKKKTPVSGMAAARSEKQDKRLYNRRYRRACNQSLHMNPAREVVPLLREYSNPAAMAKDGKAWFDPKKFPRLMRK
ncbi:MAG: hypothetical protein LC802_11280 [Acidobacteria bacterium]|nr:hypothetical protein [Acidobacteriota bacterium]